MTTVTVAPVAVPLRQDATGALRIGDSQVLLEMVVRAFRKGATPEGIVQSFDTLKLADVYAVLAYYLAHQDEVEAYMRRNDAEAQAIRHQIEATQPPRTELRERLLRRAKAMEGHDAAANQ